MDELIAADHDADMRGAGGNGAEEHQVAWRQPAAIDGPADTKLLAHFTRHRDAMLLIDVLHESAAIKPVRIVPARTVWRAS
jgi:hypothetical protein